MKDTKLSALEELRREKAILKQDLSECGDRIEGHWTYVKENLGSLLLASGAKSALQKLGIGSSSKKKSTEKNGRNAIAHNVFSGVLAASPLIWEIAQPMLVGYAMKKVKSIFTRKKRKK